MKRQRSIVLAVCAALFVVLFMSACAPSPQSLILGKWEVENAPVKMAAEFNGDGTAKLTLLGQTIQGAYKLKDANELEWTVNGISSKFKAKVTGGELELTDSLNRTVKYKRR